MARNLVILMLNPSPDRPDLCGAPLLHAAAAAAMDAEVEVHFIGASVKLLAQGVAQGVFPRGTREHSVRALMDQALQMGVKFYACPAALAAHQLQPEQLMPEVSGIAGAATYLGRVFDADWASLTY